MRIDPKEYDRLFRYEGEITVLHSQFFAEGSHGKGDPIIIYKDGIWDTFINKDKEKVCLKKGLELFDDKDNYKQFADSFRKYLDFLDKEFKTNFSSVPKDVPKAEFVELINKLSQFWDFYGFTEYFYTDSAYVKLQEEKDKVLQENIKDFEKLKFEGRDGLNLLTFKRGIIPNILRFVSKKFLKEENDAFYLYSDELIGLFDGKKVDNKTIKERKKCYVVGKFGHKIERFDYEESLKITDSFTHIKKADILEGTAASQGKAQGKVVIAPMMIDEDKIKKITDKMNVGDILVAQSTTPELTVLCHKASAIVTDQGGMLSHAAIISREIGIPCIVGTGTATIVFNDGDFVEVDADKGVVRRLKKH